MPKRGTIGVQFFEIETSALPVNTILFSKNSPKNSEHSEEGYDRGASF
jgi:hypothetical protein